jgi:hypothetical protein
MEKILLILCEGAHDVAFLYKIFRFGLSAKNIESKKITQFDTNLSNYFINTLKNYNYEDGNLLGKPKMPVPLELKKDEENIQIFIYGLGGDKQIQNWKNIIQAYQDLINSEHENENYEISLALFFDADKEGSQNRLQVTKDHFRELLPEIDNITLIESIVEMSSYKKIGLHIFANDNGTGNLEDILIPLMSEGNEAIFENAASYFDANFDEKRKKGNNAKKEKSMIGIAGNLQHSGVANNSIIKQSDYITKEKVEKNEACQKIIQFFEELLK